MGKLTKEETEYFLYITDRCRAANLLCDCFSSYQRVSKFTPTMARENKCEAVINYSIRKKYKQL
tara:strand:- start:2269 stop:2460 length:192 start_codon:yes stop_codon:yes gene_type:complete